MKKAKRKTDEQYGEITKASHKPGIKLMDNHIDNVKTIKKTSSLPVDNQNECLFNIPHRKDSFKLCKGKIGKLSIMKTMKKTILDEGMDVKEFRQNIDQTNERSIIVNNLLKLLEDFNTQYSSFSQDFILSLNSLLDVEILLSGDSRRQQESMYFLQENLEKIKLVIPTLQRHCKVVQTIINDTSRVEERLATYIKAIYQFSPGLSRISFNRFEGLLTDQ